MRIPGSEVDVVVSRGPADIRVPPVVGLSEGLHLHLRPKGVGVSVGENATSQVFLAYFPLLIPMDFLEREAEVWDRGIDKDVAAGRLDFLAEEALREHRAGKTKKV